MKLIDKDALLVEIKRRRKNLAHTMNKFYYASNYNEWESVFDEYKRLISFINTLEVKELQEEPVSIWHDASEKPNIKEKSGIFVITSLNGEYIGSRYYNYNDITITFGNYDKWAYLNDLLNLSNIERIGKDQKEEPVSEELNSLAKKYSFNIQSELFNQLTKEQQALWRKEIEQAFIDGSK